MIKKSTRARIRARREAEAREANLARSLGTNRRAFVELSEDYKWIEIWFPFTVDVKNEIKAIDGAHFKDKDQGGPKWRVPRDLITADKLRELFGPTEFAPTVNGKRTHLRGLWIGDALRAWARQQRQLERNLNSLTSAKDAKLKRITPESRIGRAISGEPITELELPVLPNGHPHPLMVKRAARPYQRADIKIMSIADVMNLNQPGTGKTIETIGSWVESGALDEGPILVVGPVKSLENTWLKEALRWLGDRDDVSVYTDENTTYRRRQVEAFLDAYENDELEGPTILCVNFDWIRLVKTHVKHNDSGAVVPNLAGIARCIGMPLDVKRNEDEDNRSLNARRKEIQDVALQELGLPSALTEIDRLNALAKTVEARHDHKGNIYGYASELQRRLFAVKWAGGTVDEFHKSGMNNRLSLFSLGLALLDVTIKSALSGTPMGGKPRKLWPVLNWLAPEEYQSEWRWIDRWLETDAGQAEHSKIVKALKPGIEEEFGKAHARHMIRRIKLDALPGLPPRIEQVVWCIATSSQRSQYTKFQRDLEIKIDEQRMSANNVLTQYMRLKQFANAKQRIVDGVPYPTSDSGKLEYLWEKLDENGIRPAKDDPEPGARAIVGSESSRMVFMMTEWLRNKGIACDSLVGGVDSGPILERFKRGGKEPYVIVMTVQTGGVSLDLEEASSAHAIDETWNPDDIEQFFERGDRGTRTEPLRCYIYRTRDTIQEYIADVNEGKTVTNKTVLDIRRRIHEAEDRN